MATCIGVACQTYRAALGPGHEHVAFCPCWSLSPESESLSIGPPRVRSERHRHVLQMELAMAELARMRPVFDAAKTYDDARVMFWSTAEACAECADDPCMACPPHATLATAMASARDRLIETIGATFAAERKAK